MTIYRIMASSISYYAINIEADSEQEAIDIANETDGSVFTELPACDWQIDDATPAQEHHLNSYFTIEKEKV